MTVEGTPRATRGHQICVWCKLGHRSTRAQRIGDWEGKVCDTCAREIRTEYEKGLAGPAKTEKQRAKEITRWNKRIRIPR